MRRHYLSIAIAVVLTGVISVSTHVLILQYFQAPDLKIEPFLGQICGYLIRFGTVIAAMFIYLLSKEYWTKIKPVKKIVLFAILILALIENLFRVTVMQIITGTPWMYQILLLIPSYVTYLTLSLVICVFVQAASEKKQFRLLRFFVIAILAAALLCWGIKKIMHYSLFPLLAYVPQPQALGTNQLPYGIDILIPAYITYMEPTIASFAVYHLIRNKLSAFSIMTKGLIMAGIIIVIHAGIFSILQITCSTGNVFYRLFYYGQFLWEYLTLGFLTAYSVELLQKRRDSILENKLLC